MKTESNSLHSSAILSDIAHEIRNPLQGILASTAALKCRLEDDPTLKPLLDRISVEINRINQIIDQMVELTLPVHIDEKSHSLPPLLEKAIQGLRSEFSINDTSITVDSSQNLPEMKLDSSRFNKAFISLIRNSLQAGATAVIVKLTADSDRRIISISIQDDGSGITSDHLSKIFDPFFSANPKKLGLGLTIANHIIRSHQGILEIDSDPGKGTLATISLPVGP